MPASPATPRSTLLAFNTVERLLRGDYFHSVALDELTAALADFPSCWPVCGIGTTNWYRRNGEVIVDGSAGRPAIWWADPGASPAAKVVDLLRDARVEDLHLTSPSMAEDGSEARLPFVAVGVADPDLRVEVRVPAGADLHAAVAERCADANVGLAAVRASLVAAVDYQTVCHLPLGGAASLDDAEAVRGSAASQPWVLAGVYACNPTVQAITSVAGSSLHLHGYSDASHVGGHVRAATPVAVSTVEVFPLRDVVLRIRDLDSAVLPVRPLR
ncbi:MAG: hypothetical protein QOJ79_903 [Actinomycetota bacterium]|jgi:hypothetical protein|nr:hypothetical protein [Actinomycetota bacterium]